MSGVFMHMVTIETGGAILETADTTNQSIRTYNIITNDFINNRVNLLRNADLIIPKYLVISLPEANPDTPDTRQDFINDLIANYELQLIVGGQDILTIPLCIMNYLTPYVITPQNKIKQAIPFEKFFKFKDGIPTVCLGFHDVVLRIRNRNLPTPDIGTTPNITGKVISSGIYLDSNERRIIAQNQHQCNIKEIHNLALVSTTASSRFRIDGGGLLNGILFQIKTPNASIANIENIRLILNGSDRFILDADELDVLIERISPTKFYLNPNLNNARLLDNIDTNTLNLSRFDTVQISITTNLAEGFNIDASFIVNNKVNIRSGMMGKVFINEFSFGGNIHNNRTEAIPRNPATAPAGLATPRQWQMLPLDFDIPADIICPITYEPIDTVNDGVYKCITCHNLIGFSAFTRWLSTSGNGCPLCRSRDIGHIYYKRI